MSVTGLIFDVTLERTGSSITWESLDEGAAAALRFIITKLDRYDIWFGILGLFSAWGIKRKENFAWKLGILWGFILLTNGVILAIYELFILGWSTVCLQTPVFIIVSVITLGSLIVVKKEFPADISVR